MIEELDYKDIVSKSDIVKYYLKGEKVRGRTIERKNNDPSPITYEDEYCPKTRDIVYENYKYYNETMDDWVSPNIEKRDMDVRIDYPDGRWSKHYEDFSPKDIDKEEYRETIRTVKPYSDNESKEEVK